MGKEGRNERRRGEGKEEEAIGERRERRGDGKGEDSKEGERRDYMALDTEAVSLNGRCGKM